MNAHHRGYACADIGATLEEIKKIYKIESVSEVIYDSLQDASLCFVKINGDTDIELVSGNAVKNYLSDTINLYHICYEVSDLQLELDRLLQGGSTLVVPPIPAKLFDNRIVAFVQTSMGLIELLDSNKREIHKANSANHTENIVLLSDFTLTHTKDLFCHLSNKLNIQANVEHSTALNLLHELVGNPP